MIQKKICMLGSYGVGKTSLVSRFVHSIFSENYQTTIGVRIDRKRMMIANQDLNLLVWDLHGDDQFQRVRASYLRGMSGYFLVVDSTRNETLQVATELHQLALDTVGDVPFLTLINKCDLKDDWNLDDEKVSDLNARGWILHRTSAKTGRLVDESFELLAKMMLESGPGDTERPSAAV